MTMHAEPSLLADITRIQHTLSRLHASGQEHPLDQALYQRTIHHIRGLVRAALPADATVLVVSRGDTALLSLDGRTAWHFPMTMDGEYAGHHPADSADAITHLEALRGRGAGFLLIPSTSLWWLDYYADFARHLDRHYSTQVRRPEAGVIFRLDRDRRHVEEPE